MALSRRNFVRAAGIGTAGALTTSFIGSRGRENMIWSALEPTLHAVEPGTIVISSNENPMGPGAKVLDAIRAAFGDDGVTPGTLLRQLARPDRRAGEEARRQAREHRPRLRLDPDPAQRHPRLHRERQAARRDDPDLRGVRRLRDAHGATRLSASRSTASSGRTSIASRPPRAAPGWCSSAIPATRRPPSSAPRATNDFLARIKSDSPGTAILVDEAYFDYVTNPDHETFIPLAVQDPSVIVARTFSKAYGMAGLRIGYAVGHVDTIKKLADWDAGVGTSSMNVLAMHGGDRGGRAGRRVHHEGAGAQRDRARLHDEVVRRSRHEAGGLAGELHVRQHRTPGEGVPRRLRGQGRAGRARLPAIREDPLPHRLRHDGGDAEGREGIRRSARQAGYRCGIDRNTPALKGGPTTSARRYPALSRPLRSLCRRTSAGGVLRRSPS